MKDLRKQLVDNPYAWPGGYPRFAVMEDGGCLCADCCESEAEEIDNATPRSGWNIEGVAINWEDSDLLCDHCGGAIESAYGEDSEG